MNKTEQGLLAGLAIVIVAVGLGLWYLQTTGSGILNPPHFSYVLQFTTTQKIDLDSPPDYNYHRCTIQLIPNAGYVGYVNCSVGPLPQSQHEWDMHPLLGFDSTLPPDFDSDLAMLNATSTPWGTTKQLTIFARPWIDAAHCNVPFVYTVRLTDSLGGSASFTVTVIVAHPLPYW